MNRINHEGDQQGGVRKVQVTSVTVRAPHGQTYRFVRGKMHTAYDVAAFVIRAARLNVSVDALFVTTTSGVQLFPPASGTVEGRQTHHAAFEAASTLFVHFRPQTSPA